MLTLCNKNYRINNSGQAMVEFAIILPVLFLLVLGITEFGRYLYLKNTATYGARNAVRVAVVTTDWTKKSAIFHAATSLIHGATAKIEPPYDTTTPATGASITVTIEKTFTSVISGDLPTDIFFTSFFSFSNLPRIKASATMRYE